MKRADELKAIIHIRPTSPVGVEAMTDYWLMPLIGFRFEFAGADHLLAGSDYPRQIGSLQMMRESIAALQISETDKAGILCGNAAGLLGLSAPEV